MAAFGLVLGAAVPAPASAAGSTAVRTLNPQQFTLLTTRIVVLTQSIEVLTTRIVVLTASILVLTTRMIVLTASSVVLTTSIAGSTAPPHASLCPASLSDSGFG